jgi:hypothetical protein
MTRSSKARHNRLAQLEAEFEPLLLSCLRECADGRYGLFGQNDLLDTEHRYWNWPEARQVLEMAEEIQALRSGFGESSTIAEQFLYFRSLRGANVKKLMDEIEAK